MLYMIPTISMYSPLLAWAHLGEPVKESDTKFRYGFVISYDVLAIAVTSIVTPWACFGFLQ